jgi:hypothetical protein
MSKTNGRGTFLNYITNWFRKGKAKSTTKELEPGVAEEEAVTEKEDEDKDDVVVAAPPVAPTTSKVNSSQMVRRKRLKF